MAACRVVSVLALLGISAAQHCGNPRACSMPCQPAPPGTPCPSGDVEGTNTCEAVNMCGCCRATHSAPPAPPAPPRPPTPCPRCMPLPCPAPIPGGHCTPAPTDKCGCAIGCETCTQAQPTGCNGYGWMQDDGTGSDPTPCRPAGASPQQAMCVYGDHCMCDDGYVCEDTLTSGECAFGTGGSVHCVPEQAAPPSPPVPIGDRPCVAPCAPVSAPCPPPGSGVPCRAACWCPAGVNNGVATSSTCDISTLTSACDGVAADDKSFCESQCHTLAVSMVGACKQQSADIYAAVSTFLGNCDAAGH
jgi:hypothetical protein